MDVSLSTFLHHLPVLTGLDEPAVTFLAGLAREEHYRSGEEIVREGESGNRIFFISAGRVQIVKAHGTAQATRLAEMASGNFFGEMSLVESFPRSASVVAAEDTTVFSLKGGDFYQLYRHRPEQYGIVVLNIARDLARRLRALDEKFALIST
ncbi:MAG: cyclic nucleotide-binding domain-containing protein [Opitutales bacterium]